MATRSVWLTRKYAPIGRRTASAHRFMNSTLLLLRVVVLPEMLGAHAVLVPPFHRTAGARTVVVLARPVVVALGHLVKHPWTDADIVRHDPAPAEKVVRHGRQPEAGAGAFLSLIENRDFEPAIFLQIDSGGHLHQRGHVHPIAKVDRVGEGIQLVAACRSPRLRRIVGCRLLDPRSGRLRRSGLGHMILCCRRSVRRSYEPDGRTPSFSVEPVRRCSRWRPFYNSTEHTMAQPWERLAAVARMATDGIIVIDNDGRIRLFNAASERLFGCSEQDAMGILLERFIPPRLHARYRATLDHWRQANPEVRDIGPRSIGWGLRTTGEKFPCEVSIAQCHVGGTQELVIQRSRHHRAKTVPRRRPGTASRSSGSCSTFRERSSPFRKKASTRT